MVRQNGDKRTGGQAPLTKICMGCGQFLDLMSKDVRRKK